MYRTTSIISQVNFGESKIYADFTSPHKTAFERPSSKKYHAPKAEEIRYGKKRKERRRKKID